MQSSTDAWTTCLRPEASHLGSNKGRSSEARSSDGVRRTNQIRWDWMLGVPNTVVPGFGENGDGSQIWFLHVLPPVFFKVSSMGKFETGHEDERIKRRVILGGYV